MAKKKSTARHLAARQADTTRKAKRTRSATKQGEGAVATRMARRFGVAGSYKRVSRNEKDRRERASYVSNAPLLRGSGPIPARHAALVEHLEGKEKRLWGRSNRAKNVRIQLSRLVRRSQRKAR